MQTGLRALPQGVRAVAFTLVDHPGLNPDTLQRLIAVFEESGAPLASPTYRGKRGHPVVIGPEVVEELLALPPEASPKPVLRGRYPEAAFVEVEDASVVADVDRPEDFERLKRGWEPDKT